MKVVNPDNATHDFTLIPRFDTSNPLTLYLYNEASKVETTVANTYVVVDGNLTISYSFTFTNNSKYIIKILDGADVIYRGKLIATTQAPQDYKLTDSLYIYG